LRKARDVFGKIVIGIAIVSMFACFFIMAMTTVDVVLRKLSNYFILGSVEITEMLMVVVMAFGIPALYATGGHVKVDMFVNMIPGRIKYFFMSFILLAESIICGLMIWGTYEKAKSFMARRITTGVLHIPQLPFALCLCLGIALFWVLISMDTILYFLDGINYKEKPLKTEIESKS
jgi:TRAP-type C4-dicarboxylate transport system permease small subunit